MHVTYLHLLAVDLQGTDSEVDPDGVLLLLHEYARLEALDHTGLPHVRVPDQNDFKKKVERVLDLRPCRLHGEGRNIHTHTKHTEAEKLHPRPLCLYDSVCFIL